MALVAPQTESLCVAIQTITGLVLGLQNGGPITDGMVEYLTDAQQKIEIILRLNEKARAEDEGRMAAE